MAEGIVGGRVAKLDAQEKATGTARYIDDIQLPGMLYGRIKRSHLAHARILAIDTSRAERLPGVKAVITYKDTPLRKFGYGKDRLPLQKDRVRCVGDEVAAVAAIDPEIAEEALELIDVQYDPLEGVFDPEAALSEGAPLIHEGRQDNIFTRFNYNHGDLGKGLSESDIYLEDTFYTPYQEHCCMATSGVVAEWDPSGHLTLYDPTQVPFMTQRDLAEALGIPGSHIRIIQPVIGGGFGNKLDLYPFEVICALLARKAGRPVKIVFNREEEFQMDPLRPRTRLQLSTGATREGLLTFRKVHITIDAGAYISWGILTPIVMMHTFSCMYRVSHVGFTGEAVYTNNPHVGAMRGFGNPEITFAMESHMEELAKKLGIDPLRFRLLNANRPGEVTPQGSRITSCGFTECIQKAAERGGWEQKRVDQGWRRPTPTTRRGIGMGCVFHVGGGARIYRSDGCGAIVKIDDFGKVTVISGATDIGQGAETVVAQIVAEELGIPIERIVVSGRDSDIKPWDVGVHASRTTFIAGNAARLAAIEAKKELLRAASEMLSEHVEKLCISGGIITSRSDPQKRVGFEKVVRSIHFRNQGNIIIGKAFYDPPSVMVDGERKGNISATYTFGCQVAEVEVDIQTGKVRVLRVVAAHDVGKAINPMYVEGQIEGGVMMGIGYALTEEAILKEGRVLNPNFLDYRIPGPQDMPAIEPIIVETNDPEGPFGAKGVGEPGVIPTAAAIANAVADATGIRLTRLPITPERLLSAIHNKPHAI